MQPSFVCIAIKMAFVCINDELMMCAFFLSNRAHTHSRDRPSVILMTSSTSRVVAVQPARIVGVVLV